MLLLWFFQTTICMADDVGLLLLQRVDSNLILKQDSTMSGTITMTVFRGKRDKIYTFSVRRKNHNTSIEFQSPTRDKGTKLLKNEHSIWMYFPSIEQSQRISGHMVRQGFMGGAVSYEDMMDFSSFVDNYNIVSSEKKIIGFLCISFHFYFVHVI